MGICSCDSNIYEGKILLIDGQKVYPEDFLLSERISIRKPISTKYNITKKIGHGGTCDVFLATDNLGKIYAIKEIKRKTIKIGQFIANEARIGRSVNHPHIIKINEIYETLKSISFVMEIKQGGDLFDLITNSPNNRLEPYVAIELMVQIFDCLNYLHNELKVCHRDIKPENFLITINDNNKPYLYLIDFGFAHYIYPDTKMTEVLGTESYTAPEMMLRKPYDEKVDIWSSGIILFNMMTGCDPYEENKSIEEQIINKIINFDVIKNDKIKEFIKHLLDRNTETRFNSEQALIYAKQIQKEIDKN